MRRSSAASSPAPGPGAGGAGVPTASRRLGLLLVALAACATTTPPAAAARAARNPFLHASGRQLLDGQGRTVVLKGICFGNDVWSDPASPPVNHGGEADYRMVRGLGMNAVRFYLNDALLEDAALPFAMKESGLAWIDQNLAWARAQGVYLILNLHVPPGGFQPSGGGGALWRQPESRRRFVALWRALAHRYRDEPALAGYDLLNEPVVAADPGEWEALAREALAAIRAEDPRHAVFVERTNAVLGAGSQADWTEDRNGQMNFFLLDDANVVYEFHFYKPMAFTHQGAAWVPALRQVRTRYPGPFRDWDGTERVADRAYLERELAPYLAFGRAHGVPLYLGEFGVIRDGFGEDRNGVGWVDDVIEIILQAGVSLTYHAFHEPAFGLYASPGHEPPAELNRPLAELFAQRYR